MAAATHTNRRAGWCFKRQPSHKQIFLPQISKPELRSCWSFLCDAGRGRTQHDDESATPPKVLSLAASNTQHNASY